MDTNGNFVGVSLHSLSLSLSLSLTHILFSPFSLQSYRMFVLKSIYFLELIFHVSFKQKRETERESEREGGRKRKRGREGFFSSSSFNAKSLFNRKVLKRESRFFVIIHDKHNK